MRQIGEIPSDLDPRVLEDHLLGLGMKSRIDRRPDGWAVWIIDENHVSQAREELQAFLAEPTAPRFRATAAIARDSRRKEQKLEREYRRNDRNVSDLWALPTIWSRPVTTITVGLAILVFLLQNSPVRGWTVAILGFFNWTTGLQEARSHLGMTDILNGEIWRLVTPAILHFSIWHILFNCYWTMILGSAIEQRRGSGKLLAILIGSAILSNYAEYLFMEQLAVDVMGSRFNLFGGLSGVNYALFGYVWMMGENHPDEGLRIDPRTTVLLLAWLVLCFTGMMGNIANMAHLSGLAVGMILGMLKF